MSVRCPCQCSAMVIATGAMSRSTETSSPHGKDAESGYKTRHRVKGAESHNRSVSRVPCGSLLTKYRRWYASCPSPGMGEWRGFCDDSGYKEKDLTRIEPSLPSHSTHHRNPVLNSVYDTSAGEDRASMQTRIQARRNIWMASHQAPSPSTPGNAGGPLPGVLLL